ncbi:hypothetical protein CLV33_10424 [Jejuia pallidilutea]|uniref:Uncharacterized protein n=2 Tax=Jejuia pallidilutea TaxID=504487 RepID=A0A362WZW5_9FLAO|nr:hypothetical protein CLV33_10424 [Jejuia pallidilutea]
MFNFGTSSGQVLYSSRTNIGTSSGQALVPINKHIQTTENNKNINKRENLKNLSSEKTETHNKQNPETSTEQGRGVPYRDNLKTSTDKNYNEPL